MTAVQVMAAPAMASLLVLLAQRQRLKPTWPLLGISLLQLLTPLYAAHFGPDRNLQVGYGLVIPVRWSVATTVLAGDAQSCPGVSARHLVDPPQTARWYDESFVRESDAPRDQPPIGPYPSCSADLCAAPIA